MEKIPWYIKVLQSAVLLYYRIRRSRLLRDFWRVYRQLPGIRNHEEYIIWCVYHSAFIRKYKNKLKSCGAWGLVLLNTGKATFFLIGSDYVESLCEVFKGCIYVIIAKRMLPPIAIRLILIPTGFAADLSVSHSVGTKISNFVHWVSGHYLPKPLVLLGAAIFTGMTFGVFAWNLIIEHRKQNNGVP